MSDWSWDEPQELEGWFWRPGEDERFYGRLRHDPHSGPTIHFFDAPTIDPLALTPLLPVDGLVLGELPGEVPVTLDGFFPERWTSVSGQSTGQVDGFAQTVYRGCHLDDGGLIAAHAGVDLVGLDDTLVGVPRDRGILNPRAGKQIGPLHEGEQLDVVLTDRTELTMSAGEQGTTSPWSSNLAVQTAVSIAVPEAIPADELESEYVEPLRQFVVFSTRSASSVRRLSYVRSPTGQNVDTLGQPWPEPRHPRRPPGKLTLNLARIKDPGLCVARWFSLREQVGPVWQLLFAVLGRDDGLLENRFLNLMAFAEGYHRALRDSGPLTPEQTKAARASIKDALQAHPKIVREVFNRSLSHANSQSNASAWSISATMPSRSWKRLGSLTLPSSVG